jgi:hypothetical protein
MFDSEREREREREGERDAYIRIVYIHTYIYNQYVHTYVYIYTYCIHTYVLYTCSAHRRTPGTDSQKKNLSVVVSVSYVYC